MNLYIDESGSITSDKNFVNRYFVIGVVETNDPYNVIRQFREAKKNYIKLYPNCGFDLKNEIKGSQMPYGMKKMVFERIVSKSDAVFHHYVVDNHHLYNNLIQQPSLSFNFFIGKIVEKIRVKNNAPRCEPLFMLIDQRNQSVGSLNSLNEYLKIQFTIEESKFSEVETKYKDSKTKDLIQLVDVYVNTVYRICKCHAVGDYDKKNRKLIDICNQGVIDYFPYKYNDTDFCSN